MSVNRKKKIVCIVNGAYARAADLVILAHTHAIQLRREFDV